MKKNIFSTLLLLLFGFSLFSQGIKFEDNHDLTAALTKAKAENKLVFIDAYTVWCGPCKKMAREIFPQQEVGDFYNAHFVNLKLNMEAPENKEVAEKYGVNAYPTFLYLTPDGDVAHKGVGSMEGKQFILLGKVAIVPIAEREQIKEQVKNGNRDASVLEKYFAMQELNSGKNMMENQKIALEYFDTITDEEKLQRQAWDFLNNRIFTIDNSAFDFFAKNKSAYDEKYGDEVNTFLKKRMLLVILSPLDAVISDDERAAIRDLDTLLYDAAEREINFQIAYIKFSEDASSEIKWKKLQQHTTEYLQYDAQDAVILNDRAWFVFENYKQFNDTDALSVALGWAKKAVELSPEFHEAWDTYAQITFDLGNKKEAVKLEEKALDVAEKAGNGESVVAYKEIIEKFKK